ncbi:RING-H2 finger protein ATL63 [Gossypium australe]|uniref:RING-H2 finger protein ATL63 n=1 Tax=Gossypium australe TaxID=47621 RepID=A0A5B6X125_9ROSI|nr:RING-H2 finger protein ATL63 [Gossypium australe]
MKEEPQIEQNIVDEQEDNNITKDMDPVPRTMYDYAKLTLIGVELSIVRPTIVFDGLQDEDPNTHLANFLEICNTFKINDATNDVIHLRFFLFSMRNME